MIHNFIWNKMLNRFFMCILAFVLRDKVDKELLVELLVRVGILKLVE